MFNAFYTHEAFAGTLYMWVLDSVVHDNECSITESNL